MTRPSDPASPSGDARADQAFPRLDAARLARVGAHGRVRDVRKGGEGSIAVAFVHQVLSE